MLQAADLHNEANGVAIKQAPAVHLIQALHFEGDNYPPRGATACGAVLGPSVRTAAPYDAICPVCLKKRAAEGPGTRWLAIMARP